MDNAKLTILEQLDVVLKDRKKKDSGKSYVSSLYDKGSKHINDKILEECNEYIESTGDSNRQHMIHEAADLWFHTLVSLSLNEISSSDILKELENRFGLSGIDEKRLRNK
tara:strand:- start:892 stop:1221 length:330 start_codon:yes stop_codon:yes gene_type:complete